MAVAAATGRTLSSSTFVTGKTTRTLNLSTWKVEIHEKPPNSFQINNAHIFYLHTHVAVQALLKFASQYEAHYPEILYKVYFVNCPAIMPLFLKLLKPLLAPKTYSKIHIYGTNREEWEPILRGMMDPDKLWTRLGGNRVVPRTKF